jgi:hypothetical protein
LHRWWRRRSGYLLLLSHPSRCGADRGCRASGSFRWCSAHRHPSGTTWRIVLALGVLAVVAVRTAFNGRRGQPWVATAACTSSCSNLRHLVIHATGRGRSTLKQSSCATYAARRAPAAAAVPLDGLPDRGSARLAFHYMGHRWAAVWRRPLFCPFGFPRSRLSCSNRKPEAESVWPAYVRRARRLLRRWRRAAAYGSQRGARPRGRTAADHGLYFGNIYFVVTHRADNGLGHLWSLAGARFYSFGRCS